MSKVRAVTYYAAKLALVALIAWGTLASQAAWITPSHTHESSPEHCCAICHAGHLLLVEPVAATAILPPSAIAWFRPAAECPHQQDAPVFPSHSRAPPSPAAL
jgi:hypothetical protein